MEQDLLESIKTGEGGDRFALVVDYVGQAPRYVLTEEERTASVFVFYSLSEKKAVVLMVDGDFGASITNAADGILPFVHQNHLGRRGINWKDVRWIYRDTMCCWDEIKMNGWAGGRYCTVTFRPLGQRELSDALAAVAAEGFRLDSHDLGHIRTAISRSPADGAR